jgi:type IV pilus assembly protein PilA
VAIPQYQNYVSKSQVSSALAEISPGKTVAQTKLSEGITAKLAAAADVGLTSGTARCKTVAVDIAVDGGGTIVCTMNGASQIQGKTLTLTRETNANGGTWACTTSVEDANLIPQSCAKEEPPKKES